MMGHMTTAESTATATHPRSRSMESWRARLGVLASRGETDGPRVAECRSALSWHRVRSALVKEMAMSEAQAEALLELARQPEVEIAEAVAR